MAADLRDANVRVETSRLDEHRRRVSTAPTIRLYAFTQSGHERGVDISEDDALLLAVKLLQAAGQVRASARKGGA